MRGAKETIKVPAGHSFRLLCWTRSLSKIQCSISPNKTASLVGEGSHWHYHQAMELTLFTRGSGTRFVGDNIARFISGDLVLLGENLPHYWHTDDSSSGISLQWHFPNSHPFWGFPENLELSGLFLTAGRGLHIEGHTAQVVSKLLLDLPGCAGYARLAILMTMLSKIAQASPSDRAILSRRQFNLSNVAVNQEVIARAVQHTVAHFREEVRLEELLVITDMSRATFARQFKKHVGRSFSSLLNRLRLEAACRELRESQSSVLDIAFASGFTQISFFNRLFRRELKCSPVEYRERHAKRSAAKLLMVNTK